MQEMLINIGLTELQAIVYLWLLDHGGQTPPQIAEALNITRSNTYKVLDSLDEKGLVSKAEVEKKLTFFPEDPIALSNIVADERNKVIALEENTKQTVFNLRGKYRKSSGATDIKTRKGAKAVKAAYEQQASLKQPVHFIKSRSDITVMGFEAMDNIRKLGKTVGFKRFGITPDSIEGPVNPDIDKASNLSRTWVPAADYTSPVEWSVTGNELNIIVFDDEPQVIQIKNSQVADSFLQIWKIMDKNLRANPEYKNLPKKAKRAI